MEDKSKILEDIVDLGRPSLGQGILVVPPVILQDATKLGKIAARNYLGQIKSSDRG